MIEEKEEKCSEHPKMDLSFVCMNSGCLERAIVCAICLKNQHHFCPDESVIYRRDLSKIQKDFRDLEKVKNTLLEAFKEFAEKVSKETEDFGKNMEKSLELGDLSCETQDEILNSMRQFLQLTKSDNKPVTLSMIEGGQDIEENFASDIEKIFKEFLQASRDAFQLNLDFKVSSFLFNKQIIIKPTNDRGLNFMTREESNSTYFTAISKQGQRKGSMRMKVNWVPDFGRYIEFGIMKAETALEEVPRVNFVTSQTDSRAWTFSGCYISQVDGRGVANNESDPSGLAIGKEYILTFDADKGTISFTGDGDNVCLNGQIPDSEYVFYIVFYYPETSMTAYFT